jgi:hypothetical protein
MPHGLLIGLITLMACYSRPRQTLKPRKILKLVSQI